MGKRLGVLLWALSLSVSSTFAGGDSAPAQILDISILSDTKALVNAQILGKHNNYFFGNCEFVTLHLDHVPERFWAKTWSRKLANKDTYNVAIQIISKAHAAKQPLNIGAIGTGFVPIEGKTCVFQSRGLVNYWGAVYSLFNPI
jgi:hypothetical protein